MTDQKFNNNSSVCRFIGNRDLEKVIAGDEKELAEIGGSFEAIADRMHKLVEWARGKGDILPYEELCGLVDLLQSDFKENYGADFHKNPEAWGLYCRRWGEVIAENTRTWYDDKVAVVQYLSTRGFQLCPFDGCEAGSWSIDVGIVSRVNGRQLTINPGTVHLAKDHHLLEKDNDYGVSPKEFYEAFM